MMRSMGANSGLRSGGTMVSNRSALGLFQSTGTTLAPSTTVASYVNSLLLNTIQDTKGTGIYATLATGVAADSKFEMLA